MFLLTQYPKLQIRSPAYDTYATCFKFSCNLSVILRKAKDNDICLRINEFHCTDDNLFDEGQEVDIELICLPDLINRNSVNLDDDDDHSSQASSDVSSQSLSLEMSADKDDQRLVHDDVRCMGSVNDLDKERAKLAK